MSEIKIKVIKNRKIDKKNAPEDLLCRAKRSWLGKFYFKYIKNIRILRWLIIYVWKIFYPILSNLVLYFNSDFENYKNRRRITKLKDYVERNNLLKIKVFDEELVETPPPSVIPIDENDILISPHNNYIFPEIYIACIDDVNVYGGTNLIFKKDEVICHDLYNFELDYTSEELHHRHVIYPKKMEIRILSEDNEPVKMDKAAVFVDACASNYAHWLTEVLPRIAVFCSSHQFKGIPIIIDDGLHPNIVESLASVIDADREVIALPIGRGIHADKIFVTSVVGYVPFDRRKKKLDGHTHGLFSPSAIELMRRMVYLRLEDSSEKKYPKKIYLRRNTGGRKIINNFEIENILKENEVVTVEAEKMHFLEQVVVFKNSDFITGPSGAAFANLIFASNKVQCTILIGKFLGTSYWYWQNMANASGKKVTYIMGDLSNKFDGIHGDFKININHMKQALRVDSRKPTDK